MQRIAKRVKWKSLFLVRLIAVLISASCLLPHQALADTSIPTYEGTSDVTPIPTDNGSREVPVEVSQPAGSDATSSDAANGRNLIFDDEFNGSSLDQTKWNTITNAIYPNDEDQYYTPDDVSVSGGALVLKSEKRSLAGRNYTSGAMDTFGKFSFTYGKVEIRAKVPRSGKGIWPGLWLEDNDCDFHSCSRPAPASHEIDILEQINQPNTVYMFAHYGPKPGVDLGNGSACSPYTGPDFSADYHVFSIEWAPGGNLTWYIDGQQRCHQTIPGYFNIPMYLILDTAVGERWPGYPDASTPFPQYFSIDYVRVYQ